MMMDSIPVDLVLDIFSRLPPKPIARCRCVSKLWASILKRKDFKARPRLLFAVEQPGSGVWEFFSVLQPQKPSEKSSTTSRVVNADLHIKLPAGDNMQMSCTRDRQFSCGYASGLVYYSGLWITKTFCSMKNKVPVICNPNTGEYKTLPFLHRYRRAYSFFGFDPIDKLFKVVFMAYPGCDEGGDHRILTLGTGKMKWRKIKCSFSHVPFTEGICINGTLYYLSDPDHYYDQPSVIVCLDVRSEKFKIIDAECFREGWFTQLLNYKGEKLCVSYWKYDVDDHDAIELRLWVLEDVDQLEWSKYAYTLRDEKLSDRRYLFSVVGVIATTGEIVMSMTHKSQPLYVFYFNPETNTHQRVEIRGFGVDMEASSDYLNVFTFVDHIDDFNMNNAKLLESRTGENFHSHSDSDSDSDSDDDDSDDSDSDDDDSDADSDK